MIMGRQDFISYVTTVKVYLRSKDGKKESSFIREVGMPEEMAHEYHIGKVFNDKENVNGPMRCWKVETLDIRKEN